MNQSFDGSYDYSALSIKDLLDARDIYHFHLMNKKNVIGTAIGRYLVRDGDPENGRKVKNPDPRRFSNSSVKRYSWPSIIVIVEKWLDISEFREGGKANPGDLVPSTLFLPDGRAVPVCVVYAPPTQRRTDSRPIVWPNSTFGPGLPLGVTIQEQDRFATIGALVSDGHATFALTARHACGDNGVEVSAVLRDGPHKIGQSVGRQLTRLPFSEVYPAFVARQTYLGLDVGLVHLDDINDWTSNVYGLPPLRPMVDIYEQNFSLRLIGEPVVAVGAASGLLHGTIGAFFYRYRSAGGFDYVSDFLIFPAKDSDGVRQGDSGAMWHLAMRDEDGELETAKPVQERTYRPIAILWGAQSFEDGGTQSSFSTATTLSNVCKLLDVELVVEGSRALAGTWGAVGHYSIGTLAIDRIRNKALKKFFGDHADLIGVSLSWMQHEDPTIAKVKALSADEFMPLSDVPDTVWRWSRGAPERPNHHCDIDKEYKTFPTFREACLADRTLIDPAVWASYYRQGKPKPKKKDYKSGILPFRIWQLFDEMVRAPDIEHFTTAAGVLAHYVGDACQPLHGSHFHDGDPDRPVPPGTFKAGSHEYYGQGVHSGFETKLIGKAATKGWLFQEVEEHLADLAKLDLVKSGDEAAYAAIQLMNEVATILPPQRIIEAYEETGASRSSKTAVLEAFWNEVGRDTAKSMALGIRLLAALWDSAWNKNSGLSTSALDRAAVKALYLSDDFARSYTIDEIGTVVGSAA